MMRERTGSKEVKKVLRDSIIVPTWMWNKCQRSKIPAVEIKRSGCGMNIMDSESNESVYGRPGLSSRGNNEL